jgi:long-chain acyl-CoA synthetase
MQEPFNLGDLGDPATRDGDVALIDCYDWENPRILSHGEFDRHVKACARAIAARGLARGDRVAILSFNRAEVLIAYFAIMRAGLVAVPMNVKFPRETIAFIVGDAQIKFAFCDAAGRALLPADVALVDFDATGVDRFESFLDFGPFETIRPKLREAAMVLYTSGSTGRPKGVPLSHDGQLWAVRSRIGAGGHGGQRLLVAAPLFHMNALGISKVAFAAGASIVLMQFDARRFIEAIGRFKVTSLTSVPTTSIRAR